MDRAASPDASGVERLAALLDEARRLVDWLHERVVPPDAAVPPGESGFKGKGLLHTLKLMLARVLDDPSSLATHYAKFASVVLDAAQQKLELEPEAGDRRFKDPLWRTSPLHRTLLQVYLGWQRTLGEWAHAQHFTPEDEQRVQFVLDQLVAALAPSNLPLNPAALKRAETTEGASAVNGIKQWVDDVVHRRAMPQQIRSDAFRVGEDLAITPGAVVHRHPLFELIEYASSTPTVHRKPLLMVPPQINKFYIFDLRPENSLFRYLVEQGIHLFCVSWRNPDASLRDAGLEDYVQATLQAIEVVRSISRTASIGVVSACAGGLTAISAMGLLAMRRERAVSHHSLLVTAPLAGNGSVLEAFASRETMLAAADWSRQRGHMEGADLARVFAWLRPNDLVWNYWVNNYLMGRRPPSLDVLYWDNDSTRLPAALQRDFIDMIDRRVFERPGALTLAGTPIDFRKLRIDGYYVGGRDDYLMPWQGVYRAARHFGTRRTFVLSTSGHVQSIVRPPSLGRTEYFSRDDLPPDPQAWFDGAETRKGSWWPHWAGWLAERSGPRVKARKALGSAAYAPIMPAPGRYVMEL
jgi:polyhydroxyalkanoate synthase subunit PhaC